MFGGISLDTLGILWLGALLGGIAAGASGFAFALAATSIWLHRIDPVHSAVLATGCGVLLHLSTLWPQRKSIEPKRLAPFVVGGLRGVPVGVYLLAYTAPNVLKGALGIFLIGRWRSCLWRRARCWFYCILLVFKSPHPPCRWSRR